MNTNIDELAIKHNTDKSSLDHDYTKHYQTYFTGLKCEKILELGIYTTSNPPTLDTAGASLRVWSDFFPESKVIGLDISDFSPISKTEQYPNIITYACNGELRTGSDFDNISNPWLKELYTYDYMIGGKVGLDEVVNNFGTDYDIIIDDGPHTMSSQQIFLGFMFKHLKSGGIFVIEDIATSYSQQGDRTGQLQYNSFPYTDITTLKMCEQYLVTKKIKSDFMYEEEIEYLNENIEEMYIKKGRKSEIIFIIKK